MIKTVEFVVLLTADDRRRHKHIDQDGNILEFSVQYETRIDDEWRAVVRYDTAHGFVHKDILHPHKKAEKIILAISSLNEALTFADKDIKENWQKHKEQFIREAKHK
jgi:hypothetical protein